MKYLHVLGVNNEANYSASCQGVFLSLIEAVEIIENAEKLL